MDPSAAGFEPSPLLEPFALARDPDHAEPPSIDRHKLTDMGYISQSGGLYRREAWVQQQYAEPPRDEVIVRED